MKQAYIPPFVCLNLFDEEVMAQDVIRSSISYYEDGTDGLYFEDFFTE